MANTDLFHLTYVSEQSQEFDSVGIQELLTQAREINHARDLTGLLLYKDGSFFQVLEGPQDAVLKTFASIASDPRHHSVETLLTSSISHREFPEWRMGFVNLTGIDTHTMAGYSDFMEEAANTRKTLRDLGKGERLALLFKHMGNT